MRLAAPETKKTSVNPDTSLRSTTMANVADITIDGSPTQFKTKTKLIQVAPNVYTFESVKKPDPLLALLADQTDVLSKDVRIEVSNGNGVTGMAKKVSSFFQKNGFVKARLTNHQTFTKKWTTIYYQSGNYEQANQINQMLPKRVNMLENNELQRNIQVKIILGQDISHHITHFNKKSNTKVIARK